MKVVMVSAYRDHAGLERAATPPAGQAHAASTAGVPARTEEVRPSAGAVRLAGYLAVPDKPQGIVVFAHGSGSSRHSSRNRYVAGAATYLRGN